MAKPSPAKKTQPTTRPTYYSQINSGLTNCLCLSFSCYFLPLALRGDRASLSGKKWVKKIRGPGCTKRLVERWMDASGKGWKTWGTDWSLKDEQVLKSFYLILEKLFSEVSPKPLPPVKAVKAVKASIVSFWNVLRTTTPPPPPPPPLGCARMRRFF